MSETFKLKLYILEYAPLSVTSILGGGFPYLSHNNEFSTINMGLQLMQKVSISFFSLLKKII